MKKMLPVWFWVGIVLLTYGVVIGLTGIYHIFHPPSTALSHLHPDLIWSALMIVAGAIFIGVSVK